VFGYDNIDMFDSSGRRSHVERRINDTEAAVVRRIFSLAVEGYGQKRIALQLNAERACSPRAQRERPHGWAQSSVHEVLFREMYRGEMVWNRTRKRDRWGQKSGAARPAAEWLRVPVPHLRIVSDELWRAAHARIAESRVYYEKATHGTRQGRPRGVDSKYLLPGFARCGCCNGGLHVRSSNHGTGSNRWRAFFYACTAHYNRGPQVCADVHRMRMEAADAEVVSKLGELLTPDLVDEVIAGVRHELGSGGQEQRRMQTERELAAAASQVANLTDAIAMGGNLPVLVARLQKAEQTRQELATALRALTDAPVAPRIDWRRVEAEARTLLVDWRAKLTRHASEGREVLQQLLQTPIIFTPFDENGQ
jgi:hypothetical protein